jgi:diguanylate cyclase (GGDEF)-like protein
MSLERPRRAVSTFRHLILINIAAAAYLAAAPLELRFAHAPVLLIDAFGTLSILLAVGFASVALDLAREERRLRRLAATDSLTGLANRREFTNAVELEIARSSRTGQPFAMLLVDVDRLKAINDRCGHRAGDRAIQRVANALRVSRRMSDTAARIGGDEFALILPAGDRGNALQFLSRVRRLLSGHRRTGAVSVSGGAAEYPRDGATAEALLQAADIALYREKRRGSDGAVPERSGQVHAVSVPIV